MRRKVRVHGCEQVSAGGWWFFTGLLAMSGYLAVILLQLSFPALLALLRLMCP